MAIRFGQTASRLINFIINDVLPPVLRDSRLMAPLFWLAFGREKAALFMRFRDHADGMTEADFAQVYRETAACDLKKDAERAGVDKKRHLAALRICHFYLSLKNQCVAIYWQGLSLMRSWHKSCVGMGELTPEG